MKLRFLLLFFIPSLVFANAEQADTTIRGVKISFDYEDIIFPPAWRAAPINGAGESLKESEQKRSKIILNTALSKYPGEVLRLNLLTVYILKSMSFYGVGYGGTNSNEEVYLTNNGISMGYTDDYIEQTFHHEFSSILYRNYPQLLDEKSWSAVNPPGFDYKDPENGVGAIRNNESSQELDTALCRQGFLTQYALSGLENDINTVAQNLFLPAKGFWRMVDSYPPIARKTGLLISFYNKIDPLFTEAYFRRR